MKRLLGKITAIAAGAVASVKRTITIVATCLTARRMKTALAGNRAEGFVDTAVKILISIVIGALILAALFLLFGDVVMPTLTQRIRDMFNFNG